jgi:hypothetical protein
VVRAIADTLDVSYAEARAFYKPVRDWLAQTGETLSRAAVERHPRAVAKIATGVQQVKAAETELHRIQQKKAVEPVPAPPEAAREVEEWEVTVKYTVRGHGKHHGEVVDVTLRLIGRPGERWDNAKVRAAAWYAMRHGADSLKEFSLEAVDWYNTRRSGAVREYRYEGSDRDTALDNARGIFNTVGMRGLRVALVE